jgi:hypothetical protein
MSSAKAQSSNEVQSSNEKIFGLEEGTARSGEHILGFTKNLKRDETRYPSSSNRSSRTQGSVSKEETGFEI